MLVRLFRVTIQKALKTMKLNVALQENKRTSNENARRHASSFCNGQGDICSKAAYAVERGTCVCWCMATTAERQRMCLPFHHCRGRGIGSRPPPADVLLRVRTNIPEIQLYSGLAVDLSDEKAEGHETLLEVICTHHAVPVCIPGLQQAHHRPEVGARRHFDRTLRTSCIPDSGKSVSNLRISDFGIFYF